MDYLKIIEIAIKCGAKQQQINQIHIIVGGNPQFDEAVKGALYESVKDLETDMKRLEERLKKYI